jgi:hypothetical protein
MVDPHAINNQEIASRVLAFEPVPIADDLHKSRYFTLAGQPDKLFRAYDADTEGLLKARYMNSLVTELEATWGIPTVHPHFVVTGEPQPEHVKELGWDPEMVVISMADRIADAISVEQALVGARDDAEVTAEFEALDDKLLAYVTNLFEKGGLFLGELIHYHQFVYSPGASKGNRLILVDVEPFLPIEIPAQHDYIFVEARKAELLDSLWPLINNIRQLEGAIGHASRIREPVTELLESLEPQDSTLRALQSSLGELLSTSPAKQQQIKKLNEAILHLVLASPLMPRLRD